MEVVRIIPCLDVANGRVVKGVNFEGLRDAGDPVELAKYYDRQGADEIVFLDITASHEGRETMVELVSKCADEVFIPLTVGGGVTSVEAARALLRAGADKVSLNTAAILNPNLIGEMMKEFGSQCVVVAIDAKKDLDGNFFVYTHGGRNKTELNAFSWAEEVVSRGAGEILVTSMDRDGTKEGFDLLLTRGIADRVNVPVIASGGVGSTEDFLIGALESKATGLLAASVFHYGEISVGEVKRALVANGVATRFDH
ncbi:MAG: imidazole glycerol phosphate synthase subunit HisF [Acidimicrobiaceae bacterium]|nr:imidazole glycerol phosphate synthase subunit HisF [Acidimicrobiaceae bacterium]